MWAAVAITVCLLTESGVECIEHDLSMAPERYPTEFTCQATVLGMSSDAASRQSVYIPLVSQHAVCEVRGKEPGRDT